MRGSRLWSVGIAGAYRLCFRTLDLWVLTGGGNLVRPAEYPCGRVVFAHSEADALVLAGCARYSRFAILVDRSRDGEWASRLLKELDLQIVRGSSLHDGSRAFRELMRAQQGASYPIAICVDGPLGPRGEAKAGAVVFAMHTGRPIVPVAAAARRCLVIPRTWSGIFVPLLFSRTVVSMGEPINVPRDLSRAEVAELTRELTTRIADARSRAEEAVKPSR